MLSCVAQAVVCNDPVILLPQRTDIWLIYVCVSVALILILVAAFVEAQKVLKGQHMCLIYCGQFCLVLAWICSHGLIFLLLCLFSWKLPTCQRLRQKKLFLMKWYVAGYRLLVFSCPLSSRANAHRYTPVLFPASILFSLLEYGVNERGFSKFLQFHSNTLWWSVAWGSSWGSRSELLKVYCQ